MTQKIDIIARPPSFRDMRIAAAAFLIIGIIAVALVTQDGLAALWTTPVGGFATFPLLIALMLGWVGLTETRMRRPVAQIDAEGVQVGVSKHLKWREFYRIERRGQGTYESLTLFPTGRREVRRVIPIGRAEGDADEIVEAVLERVRASGLTLSHGWDEAHEVWEIEGGEARERRPRRRAATA